MMQLIRLWCRLACTRSVVIRGLKYAIVVGAVLVGINHGDAIMHGELGTNRVVRIALTIFVPYCVSVLSSVGALRLINSGTPSAPPPSPDVSAISSS